MAGRWPNGEPNDFYYDEENLDQGDDASPYDAYQEESPLYGMHVVDVRSGERWYPTGEGGSGYDEEEPDDPYDSGEPYESEED
jgi:hypothetical protein